MIFQPFNSNELKANSTTSPLSSRQNVRGQMGFRIWNVTPWAWDVLAEGEPSRSQGLVPAWSFVQGEFESPDLVEVVIATAVDLPLRILSSFSAWRLEVQFLDEPLEYEVQPLAFGTDVFNAQLDVSSGNVANAAATATLPGATGQFTFLSGFEVTGTGATGATVVVATVTGLANTESYVIAVPAGATTQITPLLVDYSTPRRANAIGGSIVVSVPAFGAGNTNVVVNAHGYQA